MITRIGPTGTLRPTVGCRVREVADALSEVADKCVVLAEVCAVNGCEPLAREAASIGEAMRARRSALIQIQSQAMVDAVFYPL